MKTLYSKILICVIFIAFIGMHRPGLTEPIPTWDKQINDQTRFIVLNEFNNEAVFDKETGLVWERSPSPNPVSWSYLDGFCFARYIGGRLGWRPPTIEEMLSLMDPTQNDTDKLPNEHPFDIGPTNDDILRQFWTMSTDAIRPAIAGKDRAFVADFEPGGPLFSDTKIGVYHRCWCVRGRQGHDGW